MIPCATTQELRDKLSSLSLDPYEIVFIHTGVNNLDTVAGVDVAKELIEIVEKIRHNHPSIKIVISEITPRQKFRDDEVKKCNAALHSSLLKKDNITIAFHSNLRNENWTFHKKNDDKHLSEVSISKFAANLKAALRRSIGIPSKYDNRKNMRSGSRNLGNQNKLGNLSNNSTERNFGGDKALNDKKRNTRGGIDSFKKDLINFLTAYKV